MRYCLRAPSHKRSLAQKLVNAATCILASHCRAQSKPDSNTHDYDKLRGGNRGPSSICRGRPDIEYCPAGRYGHGQNGMQGLAHLIFGAAKIAIVEVQVQVRLRLGDALYSSHGCMKICVCWDEVKLWKLNPKALPVVKLKRINCDSVSSPRRAPHTVSAVITAVPSMFASCMLGSLSSAKVLNQACP